MKKLHRSLVASAVLVALATPAMADNYEVRLQTGTFVPVLGQEIFGQTSASNGQADSILVQMPLVDIDLNTLDDDAIDADADDTWGDHMAVDEISRIQLTLQQGVTFGEDVSSTQKAACANGENSILPSALVYDITAGAAGTFVPAVACDGTPAVAAEGQVIWEVIQGGSPSDNNITIRFTNNSPTNDVSLKLIRFGQVQLNDLVDALGITSPHAAMLSNEYDAATLAGAGDDLDAEESSEGIVVLASTKTVVVDAVPNTMAALPRISVAANQLSFTNTLGNAALSDFDASDDVQFADLGTLQVRRAREATEFDNLGAAPNQIVFDEDLQPYGFTSDDELTVTLTDVNLPESNPYDTVGGSIFLTELGTCAAPAGVQIDGDIDWEAGTVTFDYGAENLNTTEIEATYKVCFVADGDIRIPVQQQTISAELAYDPINARYDNVTDDDGLYGPLLLNGCTASFFNVPLSNNASDLGYVRLSNTSSQDDVTGGVTGVLYRMDGSVVEGTNTNDNGEFPIGPEIAQHGTAVYTTADADLMVDGDTVAYSIPKAAGFAAADIDATGVERLRLVVTGAFPVCEGLGLIRAGNSVVNMTATTQGNGDAQGADDANDNRGNNTN